MNPASYATTTRQFHAKPKYGNGTIIALGLTIILLFAYSQGAFSQYGFKPGAITGPGSGATCTASTGNTYTIQSAGYQCGTGLTLALQVSDPLAGSGLNAPVNTLYQGTTQIDTCTGSSTGGCNSALTNYQTGMQVWDKIALSNYPTIYVPIVVPPIPVSATLATSVNIPLYDYQIGAMSMTVIGSGGTSIASGQVYWWAADTLTQVTLSTTLTETSNNKGWISTYDFIDGVMNNLVLEISDGGGASSNSQYLTVSGPEYTYKAGVTNYWQYVLPDGRANQVNVQTGTSPGAAWSSAQYFPTGGFGQGSYAVPTSGPLITGGSSNGPAAGSTGLSGASTCQLISTTNYGCSLSFQTTVGKGNLAAGQQIILTYKLWENYDQNYFAKSGGTANPVSGQPTAANIGSSSTFTIKFNG